MDAGGPLAVVTGGARGIGFATACALVADGWDVVIVARTADSVDLATKALAELAPTRTVRGLAADVADPQAVTDVFTDVRRTEGRLDALVACAGVLHESALATTSTDELRRMLAVNVEGTYWTCQRAARLMARQRRGAIVTLSSVVARRGVAGQSAYAASKAAVEGMTIALADELAPLGIRVNAVAPGIIATDMTGAHRDGDDEAHTDRIALGRHGRADEVAAVIAHLVSDRASYMTGEVVGVSGGMRP